MKWLLAILALCVLGWLWVFTLRQLVTSWGYYVKERIVWKWYAYFWVADLNLMMLTVLLAAWVAGRPL